MKKKFCFDQFSERHYKIFDKSKKLHWSYGTKNFDYFLLIKELISSDIFTLHIRSTTLMASFKSASIFLSIVILKNVTDIFMKYFAGSKSQVGTSGI
ncbi:hypothetical protein BpHYR1_010955 [Brachionus plicatilis]|uniref:Uncharacterized protein n=1 Tax=Brachionus plicatilis TaxID=10195 RepID=A0A3M7SNV2_BRAPC|nr:hypothetical protein BpHYR1_010955 [Brachionus plicatilis]